MASTGWGWGGLRASWRCGRATTSESKQLLPGPPCSPSWFFFVVGFQTWGMLSRGSARFLKFPTSPSSDCLPCPVFCPSPSGALPARCPAPTAIPPNKVSGPLGDATLPPPPHRFPPSSATNVRVWEGGQMPPRTLEQ